MPRYLISFDRGAMDHIPDEDGPPVSEAAHAAVQEAMDAGVFVFAGGVHDGVSVVTTDGTVTDGREDKGLHRRTNDHRRPFARGRGGVGHQDRHSLPLRPGAPRDHGRPDGWQLIAHDPLVWASVREDTLNAGVGRIPLVASCL